MTTILHHHRQPPRAADYLIQNRRRDEAERSKHSEHIAYYAKSNIRSEFEHSGVNLKLQHMVSNKMKEFQHNYDETLQSRREKLKQLLESDDRKYSQELQRLEESFRGTRISAMKSRLSELKSKRECERRQLVSEKLTQQFQNECDELRHVQSHAIRMKVAEGQIKQSAENIKRKENELKEKQYFDELYDLDRQKKVDRDLRDRARIQELNKEMVEYLDAQVSQIKKARDMEEKLKLEESELMKQEFEIKRVQELRIHNEKLASQRQLRLELDEFNKSKILEKQKQIQQSVEEDIKMLERIVRLEGEEKESMSRRKEEERKRVLEYLEYLRKVREENVEREKMIEKMRAEENEKVWKERVDKWNREQERRNKLMKEVLEVRHAQVLFLLEQNRQRQEQEKMEREITEHAYMAALRREAEEKEVVKVENRKYRDDLIQQVLASEERKKWEEEKKQREREAVKDAQRKYEDLLQTEVQGVEEHARVKMYAYY